MGMNVAPVHMTHEDGLGSEKQPMDPNDTLKPSSSLTPAEREMRRDKEIDDLKTQMSQLMTMMEHLTTKSAPPPKPTQYVDPQIAELEANFSIPRFPYPEPDQAPKKAAANLLVEPRVRDAGRPTARVLRDYHDIAEDIINRKMRQIAAEQGHQVVEDELQKPYESWQDRVPFPAGWHPPKFRQFDGTGDATEHLAYFEAICGDTAHSPSLLLRQFLASLTSAAFHWYSRLPAWSIRSWSGMKDVFKSHFISLSKEITVLELSQIKQKRDEKIEDYVVRFRNSYVCLTREMHAADAVQMCIHGMQQHWLVGIARRSPKTFSELGEVAATKMEFERAPQIMELYKNAGNNDNRRFNSSYKTVNNGGKPKLSAESNATTTVPVFGPRDDQRPNKRPNIRELLNKQYVFRRDLVKSLFEQMNEHHLLTLPNPTRPDQVNMVENNLYCPYHRYVGHKIEDCIAFKEWLQRAVDEGKLALKPEAINPNYQAANVVTVKHTTTEAHGEEYWAPFMQVEEQLRNLHLSPVTSNTLERSWQTVTRRSPQKGYRHGPQLRSMPSPVYQQRDLSKRRMPPRFVPRSEGDEAFPMAPRSVATLGQFFPKQWGQPLTSEDSHTSVSNTAPCNMIITTEEDSDLDNGIALTPEEREALRAEKTPQTQHVEEVNMNLRSGKEVIEPLKSRQFRFEKDKGQPPKAAPAHDTQQGTSGNPPNDDVEYNIVAHLKRIPALLSVYDALVLMPELRQALIKDLERPEIFEAEMAEYYLTQTMAGVNEISFSEEDKIIMDYNHNRPLYIEGNIGNAHLRRILIDPGLQSTYCPLRV